MDIADNVADDAGERPQGAVELCPKRTWERVRQTDRISHGFILRAPGSMFGVAVSMFHWTAKGRRRRRRQTSHQQRSSVRWGAQGPVSRNEALPHH